MGPTIEGEIQEVGTQTSLGGIGAIFFRVRKLRSTNHRNLNPRGWYSVVC